MRLSTLERLWSDFRLSTIDSRSDRKRAAHLRFWGWVALGFSSVLGGFLVDFGLFSGCPCIHSGSRRFLGIRLGALYCRFCGFFCLGGYLYHQRQKRLTEPQNSRHRRTQKQPRRSTPERSQKKSRQRSCRQRLLYFTLSFSGSRTGSRAAKPTYTKQPIFYTSLYNHLGKGF